MSFVFGALSILPAMGGSIEEKPLHVRLEGIQITSRRTVELEIRGDGRIDCDSSCLQDDLDRLERLGIFADVRGRRIGDTLVFEFVELPMVLPVPNGRISEEEGVSLGAGLKSPNLFGRAVAGEFLFLAGSSMEYQLSLLSARVLDLPLGWEFMGGRTERWDDGRRYQELSHHALFRLQGPTDRPLRVVGESKLAVVDCDRDGICLEPSRRDAIPSVRGGLLWDTRNRLGLTTSGLYQEASAERVGGPLGGPVDAVEVLSDTRAWIPLPGAWGLHLSNLLQWQTGTVGGYRTYVVGGVNTARGLPGSWAVAESENLSTVELRRTILEPRPFRILGQNLFWGMQAVAGADLARTWNQVGPDRTGLGCFGGMDILFPFIERIRMGLAWSPGTDRGPAIAVGLFEKSVAQRYRVR